ncbi:MAG: DUF115 domain-containing protein [Clostridiales bacterium]|jgi:hypothetical protein|nr:DUF115 domain-containing protein [Eubacteriales bacterium]MDH7564988.1 DUF115 domain-containing protein [Clostridiales bacterium]
MDVLESNLKLLERYQPQVYQKIVSYREGRYSRRNNQVERILVARCDDLVVNMLVECNRSQYLICDHENPIAQAYAWIDKYIHPSNKVEIVFGMGFGFHLEVLLTTFRDKRVIVIEPNVELFYNVLKVRNLALIIEKSQIFVDEDTDAILRMLNPIFWDAREGGIQCQPFEVYAEMFTEVWDELREKLIKKVESFSVDIATRRHFGRLWVYNNVKNAEKMGEAANADGLKGSFRGIPGILVSAGPSLAKNVHCLNGLKDKCVIMAAGTAVNILEKYGVTPHFMVGIDAAEGEAEIHKKVISRDIAFIYSNQVATGSVNYYDGRKFLMNYSSDMYFSEFVKFAGIQSESFLSGPSVSNTCFDLLYKMGCNPIILLGQDLAYTGGSLYAGENANSVVGNAEDFEKQGYILRKDIYGRDVYTRRSFEVMGYWFEGYFSRVKDNVEIINATEGGLNIKHARNEPLAEVIKKYNFKPCDVTGRIKSIYENSRFDKEILYKLDEYKKMLKSEIKELEENSRKQLNIADLLRRGVYHPAKDKRGFDKMVARLNGLSSQVLNTTVYKTLLINLLTVDFFLIKAEIERATQNRNTYEDVKDFYMDAVRKQAELLNSSLEMIKKFLD